MKKIIAIALLLMASRAQAQNFEGTVKFSMKAEITDPKMKAQMEQGQKAMSDPANQTKMKELKEKMNDPQFKAMMEANPQMKAQMEKMMNPAAGDDMMSSMMPKGLIFKVKGGNTLTLMEGGMMPSEILHLKDQDKTYRLDRANKTYSEMTHHSSSGDQKGSHSAPEVKITKTSETMKILTYTCTKYIAAVKQGDKTINQIYWTTTEIKDFDMNSLRKQNMGRGNQAMFYEGIDGVPLKIEMPMPEATMVMEVTEIKKESLNAADFIVPPDFKETKGMFGNR